MNLLVTGGLGFIGSHIVDKCVADNHAVMVFDNISTGSLRNSNRKALNCIADVCNEYEVDLAFHNFRPDVVIHCAAQADVLTSIDDPILDCNSNIIGTINILNACVRHDVKRIVFCSSCSVYGNNSASMNYREYDGYDPLSPYAVSKSACEMYINSYYINHGLEYNSLRLANVYGPRQTKKNVIPIFVDKCLKNEDMIVNCCGDNKDGCYRDYIYIEDVVKSVMLSVSGDMGSGVINVGTGVPTSTLELAELIKDLTGSVSFIKYGSVSNGESFYSVLNNDLIGGFVDSFVDISSGLSNYIVLLDAEAESHEFTT